MGSQSVQKYLRGVNRRQQTTALCVSLIPVKAPFHRGWIVDMPLPSAVPWPSGGCERRSAPHGRLDVAHNAAADAQPLQPGVVADRVRHRRTVLRDRARGWNERHLHFGQARWLRGASVAGIGHALAERLQPDDRAPERGGFSECDGVGGDRDAQTRRRKVFLKAYVRRRFPQSLSRPSARGRWNAAVRLLDGGNVSPPTGPRGMTDYGIDHFHMNRFENRQGPFKTWPNHRRIHRLNRLMTITNRHTLASADKSVDRVDARGRRSAAGR